MTNKKTTAVKSKSLTVTKIKEVNPPKPTLKQVDASVTVLMDRIHHVHVSLQDTDRDLQACHDQHNENEDEIRKSHAAHVASTKTAIGKLDLHVFILYAAVIALAVIQYVA